MRRFIKALAVFLVCYAFIGFALLPGAAHLAVSYFAPRTINQPLYLGGIHFNPFSLKLTLQSFKLGSLDNPLISFSEFSVRLGWNSLAGRLHIDDVKLNDLTAQVELGSDGQINLANLLITKPIDKATSPDQPEDRSSDLSLTLDNLSINNAQFRFIDHAIAQTSGQSFTTHVDNLNLDVQNLQHPEGNGSIFIQGNIQQQGLFTASGEINFTEQEASAKLSLNQLDLADFQPYITPFTYLEFDNGLLTSSVNIQLNPQQGFITSTDIQLNQLGIIDSRNQEKALTWRSLAIQPIEFNLSKANGKKKSLFDFSTFTLNQNLNRLSGKLHIKNVELNDPATQIALDSDGELNLTTFLKSPPSASTGSTPEDKASESFDITLALDNLSINNAQFGFSDESIAQKSGQSFATHIENLNLSIKDFKFPESTSSMSIQGNIQQKGSFSASADVEIPAQKVSAEISLSQLKLKDFQPYITPFAYIDLNNGLLDTSAKVAWSPDQGVKASADIILNELDVVDSRDQAKIIGWQSLSIKPLDFDQLKNSLSINQIELTQPSVKTTIDQNLQFNLANLVKPVTPGEEQTAEEPAKPFSLTINSFKINDGFIDFSDHSFQPGFSAPISKLNGQFNNLVIPEKQQAKIQLIGQVDQYSPVQIKAALMPSSPLETTRIEMSFADIELTTLTPYSGRFAGYLIEKGHMDLTLNYNIQNGLLNAHNAMLLEELSLGAHVDSNEAIDLPLKLAIALLKDRHGNIDIQLPVSGDLNNPEFEIGPVVQMALMNMLTNIISAPFDLLASLVDGDSEELSTVYFDPGATALPVRQHSSLEQLAKALNERPELDLEIKATATVRDDWPHVAQNQLEQKLLTDWQTYLHENNKEDRPMSAKEKEAFLNALAESKGFAEAESTSPEETINWLINQWPYDNSALRQLAIERSKEVKNYLTEQGLNPKRIFILNVETPEQDNSGKGIEMKMELTAD